MRNERKRTLGLSALVGGLLACVPGARAQLPPFDVGSEPVDGVLDLQAWPDGSERYLTPASWMPAPGAQAVALDTDGDNVFRFASVNIPAGRTLVLTGPNLKMAPVYFLVSGEVNIAGTVVLAGEAGRSGVPGNRQPTSPGPGGWSGAPAAEPGGQPDFGDGPNGGGRTDVNGNGAGSQGLNSATPFLWPLVGGSGGMGGPSSTCSGGAGGGALLIAAEGTVTLTGTIDLSGGTVPAGCESGVGGAGSLRVLAPEFAGTGQIVARTWRPIGEYCTVCGGKVRVEAYADTFAGQILVDGSGHALSVALSPAAVFLPEWVQPRIWVVAVDGLPVAGCVVEAGPQSGLPCGSPSGEPDPTADFVLADGGQVEVLVRAAGVPDGTTVTVHADNETIGRTTATEALHDMLGQDGQPLGYVEASVPLTFAHGFSRVSVVASWGAP